MCGLVIRKHPVHRAGFDPLICAQPVAVMCFTLVEARYCCELDIRVWAYTDTFTREKRRRV